MSALLFYISLLASCLRITASMVDLPTWSEIFTEFSAYDSVSVYGTVTEYYNGSSNQSNNYVGYLLSPGFLHAPPGYFDPSFYTFSDNDNSSAFPSHITNLNSTCMTIYNKGYYSFMFSSYRY